MKIRSIIILVIIVAAMVLMVIQSARAQAKYPPKFLPIPKQVIYSSSASSEIVGIVMAEGHTLKVDTIEVPGYYVQHQLKSYTFTYPKVSVLVRWDMQYQKWVAQAFNKETLIILKPDDEYVILEKLLSKVK